MQQRTLTQRPGSLLAGRRAVRQQRGGRVQLARHVRAAAEVESAKQVLERASSKAEERFDGRAFRRSLNQTGRCAAGQAGRGGAGRGGALGNVVAERKGLLRQAGGGASW